MVYRLYRGSFPHSLLSTSKKRLRGTQNKHHPQLGGEAHGETFVGSGLLFAFGVTHKKQKYPVSLIVNGLEWEIGSCCFCGATRKTTNVSGLLYIVDWLYI